MSAILIRHGATPGNLEGRYIGCRTDEGLCEAGRAQLTRLEAPPVERVYASPMRRCVETAAILYPAHSPILAPQLRECDFGAFEGHNYAELNGRADYQAWIDSGGTLPFPGGESREAFIDRCCRAFARIRAEAEGDFAVVAHGGTLMAVMSRFALPQADYFSYQAKSGAGFVLHDDGSWRAL